MVQNIFDSTKIGTKYSLPLPHNINTLGYELSIDFKKG